MRVVAVPVKSLSRAKTRLSPALTGLERGALTLAMLEDVLDAALSVPGWETWVVSPDEVALEIAAGRGARPIAEAKPPLANAIRQVEAKAKEEGANALAVLPADVPLVTVDTLHEALRTLGAVVLARSADGSGTSLLLRRPPRAIPARFGPDSFRRHVELARGARAPRVHRRTPRAVVRRRSSGRYPHAARRRPARADPRGLSADGSRRAPARVAPEGSMPQGTIKDFEVEERTGNLLMDDRTEVAIDAVSVEGSGLRTLRIGQRVRFDLVDEAGRKVARNLQIVTL